EQKRRDGQQRTSCKQLGDWRLVSNPAALLAKVLDQLKEMLVFRNDEGQLFGVFERGVNILGFAVERDEPHQGIAIARMAGDIVFEHCYRICSLAGGMQR